jgi:hypothetical protein
MTVVKDLKRRRIEQYLWKNKESFSPTLVGRVSGFSGAMMDAA